jgi:hypothetical protein
MTTLYIAPFADPDDPDDAALFVPRTGASMRVAADPRVSALLAAGFNLASTHGFCAVMFPADLVRAKAVLTAAGLPA